MAKRIVRSTKARKQHLFSDIHEQCPPESPHQLYVNTALEAVGEKHGAFMEDLSEEVSQLIINALGFLQNPPKSARRNGSSFSGSLLTLSIADSLIIA